jgi:hypothetical protein
MAIESSFNPLAESRVGAKGLMQVLPKANGDKFHAHGGLDAVLNPVANIQVGAKILKDFIRRGGSVEAGLKLYVGAGNMTSDLGYGNKVLQEYEIRLQFLSRGCVVHVGCKTIAFETIESAMKELNEYVNNTHETQQKWRKILDPRKTY